MCSFGINSHITSLGRDRGSHISWIQLQRWQAPNVTRNHTMIVKCMRTRVCTPVCVCVGGSAENDEIAFAHSAADDSGATVSAFYANILSRTESHGNKQKNSDYFYYIRLFVRMFGSNRSLLFHYKLNFVCVIRGRRFARWARLRVNTCAPLGTGNHEIVQMEKKTSLAILCLRLIKFSMYENCSEFEWFFCKKM